MTENEFGQPVGEAVANWHGARSPQRRAMTGRYCVLEPLSVEAHGAALFASYAEASDDRLWTYMPDGPFEDEHDFLRWVGDAAGSTDPLFFAIVDARTQRPLGMASYLRIDPAMGVIEVGHIAYAPALQRTRAATQAMYLMMAQAFDGWGYRRYEWKCDALNAPSRAAAERLGFSYEGTFRQARVYKGRNRDTAWYAITDADWPRVKRGFKRWLAEDNFGPHGEQRQGLTSLRALAT